ncbi:hypothetical protein GHI93_08590 [Lactococcus hircilactis]|uniref:HTH-type transcriptional regulator Rgg C-terminal domain-containing protein n=1 Tax=Lactococcus hircilactis TaxID=1494462 RepID=A0A7X2D0X6_9LACT|nr:Rgg/GadR/MutR family transcriptional regulator [Lactococcus hircilactis]MQW39983.1 hypothetical protein [Lactococcus hircilactis]
MVAKKQLINPRYGKAFHSIREEQGFSLDFFKSIISKATLSRFEQGQTTLSPDQLEEALHLMDLSIFTFLFLADNVPVYRRYGEVFQLLREQRAFELESFETINLSKLTIQKFEEGLIMLDFAQVESALQMMHIPLYEYTYLLDKGEGDYFSEIYKKVDHAYFSDDKEVLVNVYEEAILYDDFRMIALATKACYQQLTKEELEEVSGFLFGVEVWTNLELFVFNYTVSQLSYALVQSIWFDLFKEFSYFQDNREYRIRIVRSVVLTCFALLDKNDLALAEKFLYLTKEILQSTDEFTRCLFKFTESLLDYKQHQTTEALEKMKEVIHIFRFLGDDILADKYSRLLNQYIT